MQALRRASWRIARYRLTRLPRPIRRYARKFSGEGTALPPRPQWQVIVLAWLGACIALATLGLLTVLCHAPFLIAPFGASVVLLFGHPDSPLTQPRNVVGGHLLGGVIGLSAGMLPSDLSYAPPWLVMAFAVATTLALMKATRTVHPPAGATTIVCQHLAPDWWVLVAPVLAGSGVLVLLAAFYNNAIERRQYPRHWW